LALFTLIMVSFTMFIIFTISNLAMVGFAIINFSYVKLATYLTYVM
jgi:hypothetical protein